MTSILHGYLIRSSVLMKAQNFQMIITIMIADIINNNIKN